MSCDHYRFFWWSRDRIYEQWFAKDWHILCVRKTRKMCQSLACQFLAIFSRNSGRKIDISQFWEQLKKEYLLQNKVMNSLTGFLFYRGVLEIAQTWAICHMIGHHGIWMLFWDGSKLEAFRFWPKNWDFVKVSLNHLEIWKFREFS